MIKTQNIQVYKNTAIATSFVIKDVHDNVINLTALTGTFTAFLDIPGQNETDVISKAITITDAEKGECSIELDNDDTNIDVATYTYNLTFTDGTDDFVYAHGRIQIIGDDTERITEIKRKYGLTYDYYTLRTALNWAREQVNKNGFESTKLQFKQKKEVFKVCNHIMDSNFDGVVDTSDINIYQYMSKTPYTVTDLNANIDGIVLDHPTGKSIITMDNTYPSDGFSLVIEYKRGSDTLTNLTESIKELEELYTLYRLFNILEVNQLQRGLPDKSINGVSLSFDQNGIKEFREQLRMQIYNATMQTLPFEHCDGDLNGGGISKSIKIPKTY